MNLAADAIAQGRVDPLVAADTAKTGEFVSDDQRLVMALTVRADLDPGAG